MACHYGPISFNPLSTGSTLRRQFGGIYHYPAKMKIVRSRCGPEASPPAPYCVSAGQRERRADSNMIMEFTPDGNLQKLIHCKFLKELFEVLSKFNVGEILGLADGLSVGEIHDF